MRDLVEKIDEFLTVEGLKDNWHLLSLFGIFVLAVWLRYNPANGMQYLQALDPYIIFRMSKHLALEGNLPPLDFLRYFPYAQPAYRLQLGDIMFPAIFYWLGPFLFFPSYLEWAQFYPALMGGIGVLFAYLFGKEIWNRTAGLSGAFFLATISGVMHRTSAGFFEKEPTGTMFMMISLYLFVRAWKREDWLSGIGSGLAMAGFTLSWGGSKMSWLLYPLTVGTVMMLDEDIEGLLRAYTPTVILGVVIASAAGKIWFTSPLFLANFGLLGFLWSRKLVEELELLEPEQLKYYVPGMSIIGGLMLALSPLYSDYIASILMSVLNLASQSGGGVIAGTVAENQAASLGQLVSQLGAIRASDVSMLLGYLSNVAGPWPLAFLSVAFLGTSLGFMVLRKYGLIDPDIHDSTYYYGFAAALLAWVIGFAYLFQGTVIIAVAPAILASVAGAILVYAADAYEDRQVEFRWYYFLPFFWIISNILGAVSRSRLIFLAAFPVAMGAGYTLSLVLGKLKGIDFSQVFRDFSGSQAQAAALVALLVPLLLVNLASGYATSQRLGGSPNGLWMQNLEWMEEETEPGDVMFSWWDYGYWFQSIGRRPAVADGGNAGFYTSDPGGNKVNYPIADFLTSSNPGNHTYLFRKHSVDYVVLDNTMIGKYSAVSQISNRDNSEFETMIKLTSCEPKRNRCEKSSLQKSISRRGNRTVATFAGRGLKVHVPLSINETAGIGGAATLDVRGRRIPVDCILTEDGKKTFEAERSANYCVAEDPYYNFEKSLSNRGFPARVVLVPKSISDSSLVRLYLMDGHGIEFVEKVPEASNGYIRTWEVNLE